MERKKIILVRIGTFDNQKVKEIADYTNYMIIPTVMDSNIEVYHIDD